MKILVALPFADELNRYASEYTDITSGVELPSSTFYEIVLTEPDVLNVHWHNLPIQFLSDYQSEFIDEDGEVFHFDRPRISARGWWRERNDLLDHLPNYDPDVLLYVDWFDECEMDYAIFVRDEFFRMPEFKQLRTRLMRAKLRSPI